jgi:hypothetical protein
MRVETALQSAQFTGYLAPFVGDPTIRVPALWSAIGLGLSCLIVFATDNAAEYGLVAGLLG